MPALQMFVDTATDLDDPLGNLYDVDDDSTVVTLADWYHESAELLMDQFKLDDVTPPPASGLVNGVGIPPFSLRFVDTSGFTAFIVSIDGHSMDIIQTDGIETVPLSVIVSHL
ncbi:hypothetical protein C8R44DRAFT_740602 [Mycena epipterygia]|nr:hypothetical protein C8R44DRAFT_740602 [Mycena epipterygia]